MWILPEIDIFASDPVLKRYRGSPPYNGPEHCNIDSFLNKYLHKAVDCHVWYTNPLHKLDPKKFSIATPKKGTSAYIRIFDTIGGVAPSSERIISDTHDVLTSINYIVEAEGCIIPDVKNVKNTVIFSLASHEVFYLDFSTFSAAPPGVSADLSSFFLSYFTSTSSYHKPHHQFSCLRQSSPSYHHN